MKTNFFGKIVLLTTTIFSLCRKYSPTYNLLAGVKSLSDLAHDLRTPLQAIITQTFPCRRAAQKNTAAHLKR